ncbi:MAG: [protein-PII] uridylyltransferase [Candidatus Ancaeobacter aquaticus]|nr:[protein-PII] uridylyltransferase [Candidatus Ancaeobacter aquaticus]
MIINLDKILKNAEKNLTHDPSLTTEAHLTLFKKFLTVEEQRLKIQHRNGVDGLTICRSRSYLIDVLIQHIYKIAHLEYVQKGLPLPKNKCALIANGGYGRNELNPYSDLDILFIYEKKMHPYIKFMIEKILYMLWDTGLSLGHGVRSLDEAIAIAKSDVKMCSSTFESRFIAGEEPLFDQLKKQLDELLSKNTRIANTFISQKIKEREDRHYRFGASMYIQEPNIKECIGGLRDIQSIVWLCMFKYKKVDLAYYEELGFITEKDLKILNHGYDFLMRVRNELHYTAEKKMDILTMIYQKKIAYNLGYKDKHDQLAPEIFMKEYYTHARNIAFITQNVVAKYKEKKAQSRFSLFSNKPKEVADGIILLNNALYIKDSEQINIHSDPQMFFKIFSTAQAHDAALNEDVKSLIRNNLKNVNRTFKSSKESADNFLKIFNTPGKIGVILRQMNETGFLGKYLPEFGKIVCLVQDNYYHKYTADEHTLVAIENLDQLMYKTDKYRELFDKIENPKILYLALLLHDIGKYDAEGHVAVSCIQAQKVLKRLGIDKNISQKIIFLIKNHLTFPHIAQRRDLDDEKLFVDLAKNIKDIDLLYMLVLLTYADAKAVSPGLWNEWKESLIWELFHKTKLQLKGKLTFVPEQKKIDEIKRSVRIILPEEIEDKMITSHLSLMPPKYSLYTPPEIIAQHITLCSELIADKESSVTIEKHIPDPPTAVEITVCTYDKMGLFSLIAGSFTLNNINILSAQINTRSDKIVVDTFSTTDDTGDPYIENKTIKKFKQTLEQTISEKISLSEAITEHKKKIKPKPDILRKKIPTLVTIDNSISHSKTVIEIQSPDNLGLLYTISHTLSILNVNISFAKIHTEKGIAIDTFYITDLKSKKITSDNKINDIKVSLLEALEIT